MGNSIDEQNKDDSGQTEYMWDSTDEQDGDDTEKTAYMWDLMDEQDREDTMDSLKQTDKWVIWKSKDKWSTSLQAAGFHQLLHTHQDIQDECWGFEIKGWWRIGDIRVKKPKKTFEYLSGHEARYWQGTESGLLGAFEYKGACIAGDGSCDAGSRSMGAGFCNLNRLGWDTQTPLSPSLLQEQHTLHSSKVGQEDKGVSSNRQNWWPS